MPQFLMNKAEIIEAVKWTGERLEGDPPEWIADAIQKAPGTPGNVFRFGNQLQVQTPYGEVWAMPGEWIVKGRNGGLYVSGESILRYFCEPVDENVHQHTPETSSASVH